MCDKGRLQVFKVLQKYVMYMNGQSANATQKLVPIHHCKKKKKRLQVIMQPFSDKQIILDREMNSAYNSTEQNAISVKQDVALPSNVGIKPLLL